MDIYKKHLKQANKLIEKLTLKVKNNPSVICENYGQKQIRLFIDKMESLKYGVLTYQEKCNIKDILYTVSSIC